MIATAERSTHRWLLLHGTPLRPTVWTAVSEHLPGTIWAPDVTPTPGAAEPQRHLAERIIAQARHRGERWKVVGHSFGGQVALEMACAAPDVVDELVVVCSRDTPFPSFAAAADGLEAGNPIDVDSALQRWFRPAEIAAHPPFIDDVATELQKADRRAWATALRGIAGFDVTAAVTGISAPARVIAAEDDPVGTPDAMRELADRLPVAEFSVLPDAAHMSPFLDPPRFAALINGQDRT
jgi:pimeloyl-ACP methyl ester carboxylesterase